MSLGKNACSFRYSWNGLRIAWREETNFRIGVVCAALALLLSYVLRLSQVEFIIVVLTIALVLMAEIFNTALEEFCDMVKNDPDPHIAKIKDLAAAASSIAVYAALIIGLIIFSPHVLSFV